MDDFHTPWYCLCSQVGPGLHATIVNDMGQIVGRLYGQNSPALAGVIIAAANGLQGASQARACQLALEAVSS